MQLVPIRLPVQAVAATAATPTVWSTHAALVTIILLTGCTTVPLPPWVPAATRSPPVMAAPAQPPAAFPFPARPAVVVQTSPVAPPPVMTGRPLPAPVPYSDGVAARFPAPQITYNAPGLQAGRSSFSSQEEVRNWLREQAAALSRSVGVRAAVVNYGSSQQGQPLDALVLTRSAATDSAALQATGRPTVMLVAQQHGDEPAGSEALLVVARELAQGLLQPLLERINVVLVPRANPDGVSRLEAATANGKDLATDHLLLTTPEAQALARLGRDYQPWVVVDLQEYRAVEPYLQKFGTVQKFDALLQFSSNANQPEFLTKANEEWFRRPLLAALKAQGLSSEWNYSTSSDLADKKVSMGGARPVSSRNLEGMKNAVSLVIASRGADLGRNHLQRRVHTQVTAIGSVLASTAQRASDLSQLRPYLEKEVIAQACKGQAIVEATTTQAQYDLTMLDPVTGADRNLSVDWNSALVLQTVKARVRPCGYWLSAASTLVVERLRLLGLQVLRVVEPGAMLGDNYREIPRSAAATGGQTPERFDAALVRGVIDAPAGSYYLPLAQPLANLAIAALEPDTRDSFFANRLLDNLASVARVMADPSVRSEPVQ